MNRFSYCHIVTLVTLVLLLTGSVEAQTGGTSMTLKATVSETVSLSIPPNSVQGDVDMDVVTEGNTVRLALSGSGSGTGDRSSIIRVPLIVRSNIGFRISASAESKTARLTQFSVIDVRATGRLVSAEAVNKLDIPQQFDRRGLEESVSSEKSSSMLDVSYPLFVLSGPRVSLGGTLNSSNNALQMTLLIRVKPQSVRDWVVHLTLAATAQ